MIFKTKASANSAAKTNESFLLLAKATGLPAKEIEFVLSGEDLAEALAEYVSNLAKCLEALSKKEVQMHDDLRKKIIEAASKNFIELDSQTLDDILKAIEDAGYSQISCPVEAKEPMHE